MLFFRIFSNSAFFCVKNLTVFSRLRILTLLETEIDLEKSRMEDSDMESILIELGCVNEEKKFDELTSDELFKILCYYDFDFVIRESEKYSDKELLKRIVRKYQERLDVCIP